MTTAITPVPVRQPGGLKGRVLPDDIARLRTLMVNLYFVGNPGAGDRSWALVDTGLPYYTHQIIQEAEKRFGRGTRPKAIILTHGHFDHVGSVRELAERWDVPVYAHELELPYLTGRSAYPPPDPTVGGGLLARLAMLYPRGPIDLGDRVHPLPSDATVPGMPGWQWIHMPGHSAGHISLYRDSDRAMIVGDAFVTTKQESLLSMLTQAMEINGPPAYYTSDWDAARSSVLLLTNLHPRLAATGHGVPMRGKWLDRELHALARHFDIRAVPRHGRYVHHPAIADEQGVVSVPPPASDPLPKVAAAVAITVALAALLRRKRPT